MSLYTVTHVRRDICGAEQKVCSHWDSLMLLLLRTKSRQYFSLNNGFEKQSQEADLSTSQCVMSHPKLITRDVLNHASAAATMDPL